MRKPWLVRLPNPIIYLCFFLALTTPAFATPAGGCELVLLNWSEYLDPDLVDEFESAHQCTLKEVYYESDDDRDDILLTANTQGYDIAVVNGAALRSYRKRNWLAPLSAQQVANFKYIDTKWLNAFEGAEHHAMPYFWGTLGIAYRKDLVQHDFSSWMTLFKPPQELHNKIVMMSSSRDLIGMGLKALGYSANSSDSQQLAEVEQLLRAQKPYVREYGFIALNESSSMISGEVLASMMYSGDALMLSEQEENLAFVVPSEGSNLWVDYLVVMKSSTNKAKAYAFINFLNEPKRAARLAEFVYYATPNKAAEAHLSDEYLSHPIIYPAQSILDRSEVYTSLSPSSHRRRNTIHSSIIE